MRGAVAQYVEREEKRQEKRQAMHQQAVAAWEEFQRKGLHATGEEVQAWLASRGTDNELPAPECRE